MRGENKKEESVLECDVGLGLRMQSTESFPHKSMTVTPHLPYSTLLYHHHNYKKESNAKNFISSSCFESMSSDRTGTGAAGCGFDVSGGGGGGPLYCNLSSSSNNNNKQVACLSDLYSVASPSGQVSVQRTFQPLANTSDSHPKSSGGMGGNDDDDNNNNKGISAFTVRQWEELERQIMICKYMMASIPVPPHLLLNLSNDTSAVFTSQSNHNTTSCRLDVRYTRGGGSSNYAEPWRCRRTDGKKWRCSRDVAPYQKYCERHAHKPRPRSRKPVEPQRQEECHITTTGVNSINDNNSTPHQTLQSQVFNIPAMISGPTYAQPRCTEWFMERDPAPGSALNEAWQQLVLPSPSEGLKLYDEHDRTVSVFQKRYEEERGSIHTNTYLSTNDDSSFQNRLNFDHQAQTTRHFIDSWSCTDRQVEIGHISDQTPLSLSGKLPLSSLTLSMSGGAEIDDENKNVQLGVGMMMTTDLEGGNERGFKTDWLSSNPYSCLPPGGPLGEALCLGISSSGKGQSNLSSPHGHSNSTTTSSCSKSS